MTPNEIQMLICGIAIGANVMVLLRAYWGRRDARRGQAVAQAAAKSAAGAAFLISLCRYQQQSKALW
ncbi:MULTISPECIES: hypothetical protein [unclassified Streptomyces]|uniref:hypothetical protein n=1 Tax=unclassified Streptomyces TaxID=2593676 RepID=UPI003690831D